MALPAERSLVRVLHAMIKVTSEAERVAVAKANESGQEHIFDGWDDLGPEEQRGLIAQVEAVDFQLLTRLVQLHIHGPPAALEGRVLKPLEAGRLPDTASDRSEYELCRTLGEYALRQKEIMVVMAAGRGSPAPSADPIGLLPVGPVSGKSLFQLHAEKIHALNRRFRTSLRWTIICHPAERERTVAHFRTNGHFGLQCSDIFFAEQDLFPVVDRRGKILREAPGRLALAPSGHGSILVRLLDEGRIEALESAGIRHIFYCHADNPLAQIADPVFLGHHIKTEAEISSKTVRKIDPDEKVGIFCQFQGEVGVIEHTELSPEDRRLRHPEGGLVHWAANIGVHAFSLEFLRRLRAEGVQLPYHRVEQATAHRTPRGRTVTPLAPNSLRFVTYVFDAIRESRRNSILEVERESEFYPIKPAGDMRACLEAAREGLSRLHAKWLENASSDLRGDPRLAPGRAVEISPLFALDPEELKERLVLPLPETQRGVLLGGGPS